MDTVRLYLRLIRISISARAQYRADFIVGLIGVIVWNIANLGLIGILVNSFTQLKSWSLWQIVFLYCLWVLAYGIYSLLFSHIQQMEEYLIEGSFDQFLLRPASLLIQFIGREFNYFAIADIVVGLMGIRLAYTMLHLQWGIEKWAFFGISLISGTIIELSLNSLIACTAFWTERSRGGFIVKSQLNGLVQQYPLDIFGNAFRLIVTGLIPIAFINYYPALFLLDKINYTNMGWWLSYLSPLVAMLLFAFASRIWQMAITHYTSTGS